MPEPRITAAMCARGRTVAEPRLSPDAAHLAFLATEDGRGKVVVVDSTGGPERVVTTDPPPNPSRSYGGGAFDWLPDGSGIVYAGTDGGIWLQPVRGGPPSLLARHERVAAPAVSPDGRQVAYVVDTRDVAVVGTAGPDGQGEWPRRLSAGADFALDPCWSPDGRRVAWHEWDVPAMPWDSSRIAVHTEGDGAAVVAGGEGVAVQQPRFGPDGRLAWLDDSSGWLNLRVEEADVPSEEAEHGDPSWGPGQRSCAWSPDGAAIAHSRNRDGFGELVLLDLATGSRQALSRGCHGGLSWVGDRLVAVRGGARTPTQVVVHHGPGLTERRTVALGPVAGFDDAIPEPEAVTWPGTEGASIPGRLYRPDPAAALAVPPPLICWVHGGPTGQWPVTFNPRIAYWVARGWAVLVPDHRGSTGHGRAFTQALAGRWGEIDSADVAAGLHAAAERGWGDRRRLVIMGGSAGGFTVLNVLADHPGLCAAAVDLYGVADLFDLDETTHRFEKHYLHSIVGPLPEAADRYRRCSPVNRASAIRDPLLILQGADDEVVPPAQSRAIADRIREHGGTVELHEYEGEGHGWARPGTVIDELERTESFLRRHVLRWRQP